MKKTLIFLTLFFLGLLPSFAASGTCSFAGVFNVVYDCVTTSSQPVFFSLTGAQNVQNMVSTTIVKSGSIWLTRSIKTVSGTIPYSVIWTDAITP
jgi:hypothetical protein